MRSAVFLVLIMFACLPVVHAMAQESSPAAGGEDNAARAAAVQALEQDGNTVFVVPPPAAPAPTATLPPPPLQDRIAAFRLAMAPIVAAVPVIPAASAAAITVAGEGSAAWLLPAALLTALALGSGTLAHWYAGRLCNRIALSIGLSPPETRAGKIGRALEALMRGGMTAAAFFAAGSLVALLVEPAASPERAAALMAVVGVSTVLAVRTVFLAIMSPYDGTARLVPFSDAAARAFFVQLMGAGILAGIVTYTSMWLRRLPVPPAVSDALTILSSTTTLVLFTGVILLHRREITRAILGSHPRPSLLRRSASVIWPVLILAYFGGAWVSRLVDVAFDQPLTLGPVFAPTIGAVAALAITGVLFIVHDRRLKTGIVHAAWSELFEKAAIGLGALVGVGVMFDVLGVLDGAAGSGIVEALGVAVVILAAWIAWEAVRTWVALRLADEEGPGEQDAEGEGFGPGGSRLATLLPIFRNVMFFVIVSVVVMVILASLGVNVGPLFAGAGVVGLAIGFGAQTLIRDIFSGAFFLLDDAFRKGEYVDVSGTMGTVEKISVRSFQLRHHEGRLHTIPFGEIKQLTNYSRDWVIMKLPVRLTYDTDVEKVRKLVKKLGQEMAADPEYGHLFLEPPKSQGVGQIDDSARILRVSLSRPTVTGFISSLSRNGSTCSTVTEPWTRCLRRSAAMAKRFDKASCAKTSAMRPSTSVERLSSSPAGPIARRPWMMVPACG